MARLKESKTKYSSEHVTVVTARGQTKIPRALRTRYHVAPKSRLRWIDTGEGLLIVPSPSPARSKKKARRKSNVNPNGELDQAIKEQQAKKDAFLKWLDDWMKVPDDWTPEQWDEFDKELRENRMKFRDIEI